MAKLIIEINTGNEAFGTDLNGARSEVYRILHAVAHNIATTGIYVPEQKNILDVNGNSCGHWRWEKDES